MKSSIDPKNSNVVLILAVAGLIMTAGTNLTQAAEYYTWPEYSPNVAYDYLDEYGTIDPPTQLCPDGVYDDYTGDPVSTYIDGWWCFRWGSNANPAVTEDAWIPMLERFNEDFDYITNIMRWPRDSRAQNGYYSTVYLFGSGLSTDDASNTDTGGWQSSAGGYPMVLASYVPVTAFNPSSYDEFQTGAMIHEGIHCILASMPGCFNSCWFQEGGNTWLQGTMEAQRSGNFSSIGWLSMGAAIAPFMPIECYSGWLQDGSFGGPCAQGVNMFDNGQQICTWRRLLGGTQYGECFPHAMEVILGPKSIAWLWRYCDDSGRVLQDLAEAPGGLGDAQVRHLIQEYRARQAFCDFGQWSYAFRQLLNNNWNISIEEEWSPYWIDVDPWIATCYAATTQSGGVLTPDTLTLPGWSGANQIPLTVSSSATEATVTFNPTGANMSCQLVYRDTSGQVHYGVPVSSGACSIPLSNVRNNVIVAVICNTDYIYVDDTTRTTKYDYTLTMGSGVTGTANINTKWYDYNPSSYTITASAGVNGSISPSGGVSVNSGSNQTFTFTPNPGYEVDQVLLNGFPIGSLDSYTFNQVHGDHTISVTFSTPLTDAPYWISNPTVKSPAIEGQSYSDTLAGDAVDINGDPLSFSKVFGPDWLSVASDGTLSGTPGLSDIGSNSFTVRVDDGIHGTADATLNITVKKSGVVNELVAVYEFEDDTTDSSGNGNNATASGNPGYTTGHINQSIDMDGSNDYVTIPNAAVNYDDITVMAWVNWDGGGAWQRIFDFGNNTTEYMFLTPSSGSSTLRFAITTSGNGAEQIVETASPLSTGQWVHVAVTLDGNTGTLYVDGSPVATNTSTTLNPTDFNPTINYIGESQWPDPLFNGQIDDFRIYNYALTGTQITAIADDNTPPAFTADPISNTDGIELTHYVGNSLAGYADDLDGIGLMTFSKDSGPDWLTVESSGRLSGVPGSSDVGENTLTVRVADRTGLYDTATMTIQVANVYSGVLGMVDLAGLAAEWLTLDCGACNGADLDGDHDVTFSDLLIQAYNWLADESLQLHLKFDESGGTIAGDNSFYDRSGCLLNTPVWDAGHVGGALSFDGVDDYVEVPGYKGITGGASRTCTAWIKAPDSSDEILSWGDLEYGGKWIIRINETGTLRAEVQGGYIYGSTVINDDAWHHIAVVLDSDGTPDISEVLLYVDGQLETPAAVSARSIDTSATQDVSIGVHYSSSRYFLGLIDDVRIYDRPLSEVEIQGLAQ